MNKHTTFEIVAFVSAIMSALISAILLGIVCSFMIVTRDQQQEVRTVKTGDYRYSCVCYHCRCRRPYRLHLQGDRRRSSRQRLIGSHHDHTGMG